MSSSALRMPSTKMSLGPRERLELFGPEKLSDADLLAILMCTGPQGLRMSWMRRQERWRCAEAFTLFTA